MPGLRTATNKIIGKTVRKTLALLAKRHALEYFEQIAEEEMQEIISIVSEKFGEIISGVKPSSEKQSIWERLLNVAKQTAMAMPFFMGPKHGKEAIFSIDTLGGATSDINSRNAQFYQVDTNTGVHPLAKPIHNDKLKSNEVQKDPAAILQDLVREGGGTAESQRWKYGREIAGSSKLLAWANAQGRKLDPITFRDFEAGGGEHIVIYNPENQRLYKATKPGLYGANAEDAGAYLQRWALSNRIFGDDVKFEGIVIFSEESEPRAVISQPFVAGRDSTPEEINNYLKAKGFRQHGTRWVHPIVGVTVWDVSTAGNAITNPKGNVHPIDFIVEPSTPQELREIRTKVGVGMQSSF